MALRLPSTLKAEIEADAAEAGRSANAHVLWLYRAWIKAGKPANIKAVK